MKLVSPPVAAGEWHWLRESEITRYPSASVLWHVVSSVLRRHGGHVQLR